MEDLLYLLTLTKEDLKSVLYQYLKIKQMNPTFEDGFVYAEGEMPVLLVAHMDTVFSRPPIKINYDMYEDIIYNPYGGLGGDDRCGVYAIIKLLEKYKPHVLFTEDEEIGCIGAQKAVNKLKAPNVKYIIEFDRKGNNDCVFYDCDNKDFINYIESFGFKTNYGTYSDILILGSSWDIATVNLSSGYYNEHTQNEYIVFKHLIKTIRRTDKMLKELEKAPYFDYQDYYKQYMPNNNQNQTKTLSLTNDKLD